MNNFWWLRMYIVDRYGKDKCVCKCACVLQHPTHFIIVIQWLQITKSLIFMHLSTLHSLYFYLLYMHLPSKISALFPFSLLFLLSLLPLGFFYIMFTISLFVSNIRAKVSKCSSFIVYKFYLNSISSPIVYKLYLNCTISI